MWTHTPEGRQFIEEVSRNLVENIAVDELEFFDELAVEYFADPHPISPKDTELGGGFDFPAAVTPAVLAAVKAVTKVAIERTTALRTATGSVVRTRLTAMFGGASEPTDEQVEPLTDEQLESLKTLAHAEALRFGLDDDAARRMTNALTKAITSV
jgi:hypothetical protein